MGKFFKAVLISAVATGVVAFVMQKLQQPTFPPPPRDLGPQGPGTVDADTFDEEELQALTNELASQL